MIGRRADRNRGSRLCTTGRGAHSLLPAIGGRLTLPTPAGDRPPLSTSRHPRPHGRPPIQTPPASVPRHTPEPLDPPFPLGPATASLEPLRRSVGPPEHPPRHLRNLPFQRELIYSSVVLDLIACTSTRETPRDALPNPQHKQLPRWSPFHDSLGAHPLPLPYLLPFQRTQPKPGVLDKRDARGAPPATEAEKYANRKHHSVKTHLSPHEVRAR